MLITVPFDLKQSTKTYSSKLRALFSQQADCMLEELRHRKLEVVLVPNKDGQGKHRQTENTNPNWYQELWHRYSYEVENKNYKKYTGNNKVNKSLSCVRRPRAVSSLKRIVSGEDWNHFKDGARSQRDFDMRQIIFDTLTSEYINEAGNVAPIQLHCCEHLPLGTEFNFEGEWKDSLIADPASLDITLLPKFKEKDIPDIEGLYFLFDQAELVYIGVSNQIKRRIRYHLSVAGQRRYPKKISKLSTYLLFDYNVALKLERIFIAYHRPKYNKVAKDQQTDQLCFYKKSNAFNDDIPF